MQKEEIYRSRNFSDQNYSPIVSYIAVAVVPTYAYHKVDATASAGGSENRVGPNEVVPLSPREGGAIGYKIYLVGRGDSHTIKYITSNHQANCDCVQLNGLS